MSRRMISILSGLAVLFVASVAFASDAKTLPDGAGMVALAAALAIGAAAVAGTLAQGRTSSAALEGIARNPSAGGKLFVPMILGLALIESLVIYALIIAFMLLGKF